MISLLLPRHRAISKNVSSGDGWTGAGFGIRMKTKAGVTVDNDVAMTYAAALCATRCIAEGVGGLPLPLYERLSRNEREPADLEVGNLLRFMPNPTMTATPFRESRTCHQVNYDGGGFAEIEFYPGTDRVRYLWPIHASRVRRARDKNYVYEVLGNDGNYVSLYAHEMLHIPGMLASDGIWSKGVVNYGRETIGGAIGVDRASYSFLGSGGQPKGILTAPGMGGMDKRDARAAFRKEWEEIHGNPELNVPTIAILGPGFDYKSLEMLGAEANQIIQSRLVNKTDIATLYGIPAYKIPGAEGKETAGTVEQKAIEFVVYSLMPWAKKWEEQCGFKLLRPSEFGRYYFEHNFSALLRGDTAARYNAYRIAFGIGIMTINEIRRLENMPNIGPAGDQHFVPANMTTAQRALDGDMGNGGTVGSDQNGQPSDNPMDRQAALDRDHHRWLASLGNVQRDVAAGTLKALETGLPERPIDYREGARLALLDALGPMLTKESNAAATAMKGNTDFDKWLREFYPRHEASVAEWLASACWALRAAGVAKWGEPKELAAWLRAKNVEALKSCYNHDTPETAAKRLRAWPVDRAKLLIDEIMGSDLVPVVTGTVSGAAQTQPVTVHVHMPPPTSDVVKRDADGRICEVIRTPVKADNA